jgi:hypothetical protein
VPAVWLGARLGLVSWRASFTVSILGFLAMWTVWMLPLKEPDASKLCNS